MHRSSGVSSLYEGPAHTHKTPHTHIPSGLDPRGETGRIPCIEREAAGVGLLGGAAHTLRKRLLQRHGALAAIDCKVKCVFDDLRRLNR